MHPSTLRSGSLLLLVLSYCAPLRAQWADDSAENLAIADLSGEQVLPKIAARADGGSYVGWFDHASGNYDVRLQRLDATGAEMWAHNGVLVSGNPSLSSLVDWDLLADSNGHCVLVFSDARAGTDLDVYAYRIDPSGQQEWGPNGVTLSANSDFEPAPKLAETSDGSFVFAWARIPSGSDGSIRIQKLDTAGVPQYPADGLPIPGASGEHPAFCDVAAADNGAYIVFWVRDITTFSSPRHLRAQKFDAAGNALWNGGNALTIYDTNSVPIAYQPVLQPDGAGGALFAWHRSLANAFDCFVQHVDAAGTEIFPHQGVQVSTEVNKHKLDPSLSFVASSGEMIVFWNERNLAQSQWGIGAQKISAGGARSWSDAGIDVLPIDGVFESSPRSLPIGTGAAVFFFDQPNTPLMPARTLAQRVDNAGVPMWGPAPVVVSSTLSNKDKLAVAGAPDGTALLVWHDARNDPNDVYGQNVNPDGSLGTTCYTTNVCKPTPNSAGPGSVIGWTGSLSIASNLFTLTESGSPPNIFGFFFYGTDLLPAQLGDGYLCANGSIFRLGPALQTDANGFVSRHVDFTLPPASSGPGMIMPATNWFFQWWFRDPSGPGGSGFNLSDGLEVDFCP